MILWTGWCRRPAVQEEPDSVTMDSVPERCRSPTPEPRERRESVDIGTDTEPCKTSPVAGSAPDNNNTVFEHCTTDADLHATEPDIESQPPATDQLNVASDHRTTTPATEPSHSPLDSAPVVSESTRSSDAGRKKKRKKRHRTPDNDDSKDVGQTPAKEHSRQKRSKHKQKETRRDDKAKDETHRTEDIGSTVSSKNSADDRSLSDYETKRRKSSRSAKHRRITDEKENSERTENSKRVENSDRTENSKRAENSKRMENSERVENSERPDNSKRLENLQRAENSDRRENSKRAENSKRMEYSERVEASERVENSARVNDRRAKSDETSAFMSLEDRIRLETSNSAAKSVRQYRHQDGIRERTGDRTNAGRKKHGRKSVSFCNHVCDV